MHAGGEAGAVPALRAEQNWEEGNVVWRCTSRAGSGANAEHASPSSGAEVAIDDYRELTETAKDQRFRYVIRQAGHEYLRGKIRHAIRTKPASNEHT